MGKAKEAKGKASKGKAWEAMGKAREAKGKASKGKASKGKAWEAMGKAREAKGSCRPAVALLQLPQIYGKNFWGIFAPASRHPAFTTACPSLSPPSLHSPHVPFALAITHAMRLSAKNW